MLTSFTCDYVQLHDCKPETQTGGRWMLKMSSPYEKHPRLTECSCKRGGLPPERNGKENGRLGSASARSALREETLKRPTPFSLSLVLPPYRHPSPQPKNLRVALNPLTALQHCNMCARSPPPPHQPSKGVSVLRLVDEVQSVFWAKHAHPLTRGRTLTPTGLQTKINPL